MCRARRYNEQMICERCGLQWDVDDPEPPRCLTDGQIHRRHQLERLNRIREQIRVVD